MQINPTACHSLIGLLADLLRGHGAAPTGLRSKAGQVPFGHNEQCGCPRNQPGWAARVLWCSWMLAWATAVPGGGGHPPRADA
jgi:hypothetical protein